MSFCAVEAAVHYGAGSCFDLICAQVLWTPEAKPLVLWPQDIYMILAIGHSGLESDPR